MHDRELDFKNDKVYFLHDFDFYPIVATTESAAASRALLLRYVQQAKRGETGESLNFMTFIMNLKKARIIRTLKALRRKCVS